MYRKVNMDVKKREAVLKAVRGLKQKGVTGIKVELEASMDRGSSSMDRDDCETCNGEGWYSCQTCDGAGEVTNEETNEWQPCPNDSCGVNQDDGYVNCEDCNRTGLVPLDETVESTEFRREEVCMKWILNRIAEKTGQAYTATTEASDDEGAVSLDYHNPFPWMVFGRFYNDGSVDSEFTFTVSLANEENVFYLPIVTEVFRELGDAVGQSFNVSGAGMHTALLFSEDCSYPTEDADYEGNSSRINEQSLRNFKRSMTQLLPALYFLASTNENSRALRYRLPQVSTDYRGDANRGIMGKYSAITYRLGTFEFRAFDTCYDSPEVLLDNVVVIANCMKYLSETYISPGVDKLYRSMIFGTDFNDKLERFYGTIQHIDALNIGLAKLKPSYFTLREIKAQRKFKRTKTTLKNLRAIHEKQARIAYEEYSERFDWQLKYRETSVKGDLIRRIIQNLSAKELKTITPEELEERVKDQLLRYMTEYRGEKQQEKRYVSSRLSQFEDENQGRYSLSFN